MWTERDEQLSRVASRAGCNLSTVRALVSKRCAIQPAVRQAIFDAADEIGCCLFPAQTRTPREEARQ